MKRFYLILLSFLFVGMISCNEKKERDDQKEAKTDSGVPVVVKESFQKKYPDENASNWKKADHDYWQAQYNKDGVEYRVNFTPGGAWVETENYLERNKLPDTIKKSLDEKYPDREITEIEHVISAHEGNFYDINLKQEGENMQVLVKADGTIITVQDRN